MIHRGDVYDVDFPVGGIHPAVVVTRDVAIPVLQSLTVVIVTSTVRGHPAEVAIAPGADLDLTHESVANCDYIVTLGRARFTRHRGRLAPNELPELDRALKVALGLD